MSQDKKSLIGLVPDSIDNVVKNITDKPTRNIGTTFADIWYLVFGGISQAAEKRKLKYFYALQEFENELKEKINKIPKDKCKDPDIQIIAKALEEAKYCIDKEELRNMFSSLIASSINIDFFVSPIMVNIVSSLSPLDAKVLGYIFRKNTYHENVNMNDLQHYLKISDDNIEIIYNSLLELEHLNLINSSNIIFSSDTFRYKNINNKYTSIENVCLTSLGYNLCYICLQ